MNIQLKRHSIRLMKSHIVKESIRVRYMQTEKPKQEEIPLIGSFNEKYISTKELKATMAKNTEPKEQVFISTEEREVVSNNSESDTEEAKPTTITKSKANDIKSEKSDTEEDMDPAKEDDSGEVDTKTTTREDRSASGSEEEAEPTTITNKEADDRQLTKTEQEEARQLVDDDVPTKEKELPLSDKSRTENSPYLRAEKEKHDKEEAIIERAKAEEKTDNEFIDKARKLRSNDRSRHKIQSDDESESNEDRGNSLDKEESKPFSYYTFAKELLLGKKESNKAESKKAKEDIELEGIDDELAPPANTRQTLRETEKLYNKVFTDKELMNNTNNDSTEIRREEYILSPSAILNDMYSEKIRKIDVGIKVATISLNDLANRVGMNIEKSEELVSKWDNIKKRLEDHIRSLEGVNWKKTLTYTAIALAVTGFIYQCGIVGKLPDFAANVLSNIPLPNFSNVPKPTNTDPSTLELISKIMEKPVTFSPLNTLTGMGVLIGIVMAIKALRIIRKVIR